MRLRVLQVIPSLHQGGAERVVATLAEALLPRVDRLVVCSSGGEPLAGELRTAGVTLETIRRPASAVSVLVAAHQLAHVLRRERPNVVHAHNPHAGATAALARLAARMPDAAIVTTYHGVAAGRLVRASRALALSSDLVVGVAPSPTRALVAAGFPAQRTATIFNAVDVRPGRSRAAVREEAGAGELPLVVTVGRYVDAKNQSLLLEALALVDRPLRALVVGYGPREADLRRTAVELGLGADVIAGRRRNGADLIAAADLFVLSSSSEGLPLVLLEAMWLGTPVVSTAVGGVPDVVEHERTGLLVPAGDAPALAAAIARALDDSKLTRRLANDALAFVRERCSVDAMAGEYLAVYERALAARAARQ